MCSGRDRSRFRRFRWVLDRTFFIIGGIDCSCLRLLFVLLWFFVGFALTAVGSIVLADNGMENQSISSPNRTNALYNMVLPSQFGEMDLHQTKLKQLSRSAVIPKNVRQSHTNSVFFPPNNEKQAIQAKQDRLKRERYRAEHKAPKQKIEVATNDSTGYRIPKSL